jgi:rod shape-determining protein MreD
VNRSIWKYILLLGVSLLFQITIVRYIEILNWRPDLVLILLIMFSIQYGSVSGSTAGFFSGLLSDLLAGHLLGVGTLSKAITGFIAGSMAGVFPDKSRFLLTLIISGFIHNLVYFFISTLGSDFSWRLLIFVYIVPNLFYTTLVGLFINFLFSSWLGEE